MSIFDTFGAIAVGSLFMALFVVLICVILMVFKFEFPYTHFDGFMMTCLVFLCIALLTGVPYLVVEEHVGQTTHYVTSC